MTERSVQEAGKTNVEVLKLRRALAFMTARYYYDLSTFGEYATDQLREMADHIRYAIDKGEDIETVLRLFTKPHEPERERPWLAKAVEVLLEADGAVQDACGDSLTDLGDAVVDPLLPAPDFGSYAGDFDRFQEVSEGSASASSIDAADLDHRLRKRGSRFDSLGPYVANEEDIEAARRILGEAPTMAAADV